MNELLIVKNLKMYFPCSKGFFQKSPLSVKAVDDVSFSVRQGTTYGLVGESGCGKTTTAKCVLHIHKPTAGKIIFDGNNIADYSERQLKSVRRQIQLIFQDPYGSLNPRQTVRTILKDALVEEKSQRLSAALLDDRIKELITLVELSPDMIDRYPHEMSGGQRQRVGIARALACNPKLIVCDEPVSALDVSIQAQIINLFKELQKKFGLTYLFIAHDLAVVRHIADEIGIMYLGHIVETITADDLFTHAVHPYTKSLLSAVPIVNYDEEHKRTRIVLEGEVPSPLRAPKGCPFHPRCPWACAKCEQSMPSMEQVEEGHQVACHNWQAASAKNV